MMTLRLSSFGWSRILGEVNLLLLKTATFQILISVSTDVQELSCLNSLQISDRRNFAKRISLGLLHVPLGLRNS